MERGRNGLGAYTAYVNGDLQTFGDSPCAPGLTLINGGCLRAPGTQETPYGTVAIPLAGPQANNAIAAGILGGGVTCKTERVDAGPYAYAQNVCRGGNGQIIAGADLEAESAYARNLLQTLGQPTAGGNVRTALPSPPPAAAPTPAPTPVQTGTYATPIGGAVATRPHQPTAIATAQAPSQAHVDLPGKLLGGVLNGVDTSRWLAVAAGVGALFLLPALLKEGR